MSAHFSVSPLRLPVKSEEDEEETPLYKIEIQDLARALCGALFVALPLHFTLEMWERARMVPPWMLVVVIIAAYFLNVGYCYYSNFKGKAVRQNPWLDALSSVGVGLLASSITLLLIDQLSYQMSTQVIVSCIALETVPTSFGASLAKSQLGGGDSKADSDLTEHWSKDKTKVIAAFLGGTMFAFNVGATMEPILITTSVKPLQIIGIIVFSLFASYLMVFMTGFVTREEEHQGIMGPKWAETVICYAISLTVSAILLWMFGYLNANTPWPLALPWIVVLGYATTLGGSAGRLII